MAETPIVELASIGGWLHQVDKIAEEEARNARLASKHRSTLKAARMLMGRLGTIDIMPKQLDAGFHPDYRATRAQRDIFGAFELTSGNWGLWDYFPTGVVHMEEENIYGIPNKSSPKWQKNVRQQPETVVDGRIFIRHSSWEEADPRTPSINCVYPGGYDASPDDLHGFCLGMTQIARAMGIALPLPDISESQ